MGREGWWYPQGPDRLTKLIKEIKTLQGRVAQTRLLYAWSLLLHQSRLSKLQGILAWEAWCLARWREAVPVASPTSCSSVGQYVGADSSRDSKECLNETGFHWKYHIC